MTVQTFSRQADSRGDGQIIDITDEILACVNDAGVSNGTVSLFVPGSTAGLTTIEYEPGVVRDVGDCFDRIAPVELPYAHEAAWHDGNGHSHVRAALLGASLVVPIHQGRPVLGTWQQVVLIDFDNKPRSRTWTATVIGE